MKTLATQISSLRGQIKKLRDERDALTAQTRSRNEVRALVERQIAALQQQGQKQAARTLVRLAYGEMPTLLAAEVKGAFPQADLGAVLASLLAADELRKFLLAGIEEIPESLDAADKAKHLQEIEASLLDLEREEEALIVESENCGQPVQRRRDARPEIVLGMKPHAPQAVPVSSPYGSLVQDVVPHRHLGSIPSPYVGTSRE